MLGINIETVILIIIPLLTRNSHQMLPVARLTYQCRGVCANTTVDADVAKLVDAVDLGSAAVRCVSSSLTIRTN